MGYKLLQSLRYNGIAAYVEDTKYIPINQENAGQTRGIVTGKSLFLNKSKLKYNKSLFCVPKNWGIK